MAFNLIPMSLPIDPSLLMGGQTPESSKELKKLARALAEKGGTTEGGVYSKGHYNAKLAAGLLGGLTEGIEEGANKRAGEDFFRAHQAAQSMPSVLQGLPTSDSLGLPKTPDIAPAPFAPAPVTDVAPAPTFDMGGAVPDIGGGIDLGGDGGGAPPVAQIDTTPFVPPPTPEFTASATPQLGAPLDASSQQLVSALMKPEGMSQLIDEIAANPDQAKSIATALLSPQGQTQPASMSDMPASGMGKMANALSGQRLADSSVPMPMSRPTGAPQLPMPQPRPDMAQQVPMPQPRPNIEQNVPLPPPRPEQNIPMPQPRPDSAPPFPMPRSRPTNVAAVPLAGGLAPDIPRPPADVPNDAGLGRHLHGISRIESGGRPDAYTLQTDAGKGRIALGKYQILNTELAERGREAIGRPVSQQEFLANPELQETMMRHRATMDFQKHGNWRDVASVHFSGRPAAGNNRSDILGTSVPNYLNKYERFAGQFGQQPQQPPQQQDWRTAQATPPTV